MIRKKYEKPVVMELGSRTQTARGACVSGPAAGDLESCGAGGSATWACDTGGSAGPYVSCMPGSAASSQEGDCLSGTMVFYYCEAGTGGSEDPYGCNAGNSDT